MLMRHFVKKCHQIQLHRTMPSVINNSKFNKLGICNNVQIQPRTFLHSSIVQLQANKRPMPTVYYYQNPFHWLKIRWQLWTLRKWDHEFNEKEFRRGSIQAISSVTNIVSCERYNDLEGLLTPFALSKLRRDVVVLWNDDIKRNIALTLSDIKLAVPTRVHTQTVKFSDKKICDIDMWYMGMKWKELDTLLIVDIVARFNRNYKNGEQDSDWTISFFELRKYHLQNYDEQ